MKYHIQPDSDVPASTQLLTQLAFAIASRQMPPGTQLPSTRQLAMITGLHRNTVSKVYSQLEEWGLVEAQPGSGIYVRALGAQVRARLADLAGMPAEAGIAVRDCLDRLVQLGCSLEQARTLFLGEIDWRVQCSAVVLVAAKARDMGVAELMCFELQQGLGVPVQSVAIEELDRMLRQTRAGTLVTHLYYIAEVEAAVAGYDLRVLPVDITDFNREIDLVRSLPPESCLGLVSASSGLLNAVELFVYSLRGDDLLVLGGVRDDTTRLRAMMRSAQLVISDAVSFATVQQVFEQVRPDLIRPPQLYCAENYIRPESITKLRRELGLG